MGTCLPTFVSVVGLKSLVGAFLWQRWSEIRLVGPWLPSSRVSESSRVQLWKYGILLDETAPVLMALSHLKKSGRGAGGVKYLCFFCWREVKTLTRPLCFYISRGCAV